MTVGTPIPQPDRAEMCVLTLWGLDRLYKYRPAPSSFLPPPNHLHPLSTMRTAFIASSLAAIAATLVQAAPLGASVPLAKRADPAPKTDIDAIILNYALTLEHLESAFYKGGLAKFNSDSFLSSDYPDWVRYRLTEIANHEDNHVEFLTTALEGAGFNATAACEYSFPYTTPQEFLAIAQVLEGVGTSAYLGAAALITNPAYLTAAGSILTIEARHSSWILSSANLGDGFPAPYDTPLDFDQVYSMASQFITSCPATNPALPVKAFPVLTLATAGALTEGQDITLTYPNQAAGFAVFLSGLTQTVVPYPASGVVTIPKGLFGQIYVVITSANATVTDDITVAGPAVVGVPIQATLFPF
ncbi:hypothetical protein RQP46_000440 [Phenoliferia psychrophenolica]